MADILNVAPQAGCDAMVEFLLERRQRTRRLKLFHDSLVTTDEESVAKGYPKPGEADKQIAALATILRRGTSPTSADSARSTLRY